MSAEKRRLEGERWLLQAEDDLEAGKALLAAGKYAQAAFMAQQAGEKALKGLWLALGLDPWGHSLARLIKDLPGERGERLRPLLQQVLPPTGAYPDGAIHSRSASSSVRPYSHATSRSTSLSVASRRR